MKSSKKVDKGEEIMKAVDPEMDGFKVKISPTEIKQLTRISNALPSAMSKSISAPGMVAMLKQQSKIQNMNTKKKSDGVGSG